MEQLTYFQGEDMVILAQAFTDSSCSQEESLSGYSIDVLLYTDENERVFRGNSEKSLDFDVELLSGGSVSIELPSDLSRQFKPGFLRMEMALTDSDGGTVRIARCSLAKIEQCLMAKIMSYDS